MKFKRYFVSEDDGTFWPGVIEVPSETEVHFEEESRNQFIKNNPRIVTGIILFLILSIFFINKISAFLLIILVTLICSKEWFDIFEYDIYIPYSLLIYSPLAPLLILFFYDISKIHYAYFIFPIGLIIYTGTFINFGIYEKFGSAFIFHTWFSIGVVSLAYILLQYGNFFTFFAILSISISDIAAYEGGKRIGKRKLIESISPNKTIEGLIFGLLFGTIFMSANIYVNLQINILNTVIISFLFILFGVVGDLFMSRIKRTVGIKDSSDTLPGHGGFLDRIDSYLLSFTFLLLLTQFSFLIV
ncbi:MAG: phosphatidate cytidylyltransferase [Actinomycetota bacterium]|nr:phosphatidate cytidylyltransferase [Actinomycetota bacterium]